MMSAVLLYHFILRYLSSLACVSLTRLTAPATRPDHAMEVHGPDLARHLPPGSELSPLSLPTGPRSTHNRQNPQGPLSRQRVVHVQIHGLAPRLPLDWDVDELESE
jgi:hypothetical protein